jgi:hypothetical protein
MKKKNSYDLFVRQGRNVGFTDDQIDFLWDWIYAGVSNPETFTHDDNYTKPLTANT